MTMLERGPTACRCDRGPASAASPATSPVRDARGNSECPESTAGVAQLAMSTMR